MCQGGVYGSNLAPNIESGAARGKSNVESSPLPTQHLLRGKPGEKIQNDAVERFRLVHWSDMRAPQNRCFSTNCTSLGLLSLSG